jgi:thiosulfate reductase cytochrome b subunit
VSNEADPSKYPLFVRVFHWANLVLFVILMMSGFQIFNVHPRLYFGNTGNHLEPAVFEVSGNDDPHQPRTWIAIGDHRIDTFGLIGRPMDNVFFGRMHIVYPGWMTLADPGDMGHARGYHFLVIVPFIINYLIYLLLGVVSGHFRRNVFPITKGRFWADVLHETVRHARLGNWREGVVPYNNILQKLAYGLVVFVAFPLMILTGLTMSPAFLAKWPWLLHLFNGRQTARTIHFIVANALLLFVVIHLSQLLIAGPLALTRAMITGVRWPIRRGRT